MKLDFNTPEPQADLEAWKSLVGKTEPFETRSSKLTRVDDSDITYPLVAQESQSQDIHPIGDPGLFSARLGKAPTWDVRAILSLSDERQGNLSILDALTHGATSLEFRVRELKELSVDALFQGVTPSFVDVVLVVEKQDTQSDLVGLATRLKDFKSCTFVSNDSKAAFPNCDPQRRIALSSLEAVDKGASPALEIAYLLSAAVDYYRQGGADAITGQQGPSLYLTTESTLFMNIAKLRVLKRLYAGVRSTMGVAHPWELMTLSSPRTWTRDAPWNNQLRATASLMSGAIGGATSIGVLPATDTLESQRIALTSHSVAALESNLGQVQDPARGSYLIESLTHDLAQAAWSLFQSLEERGGINAPGGRENFEQLAQEALAKREQNIARRKRSFVGVSEFPSLEDAPSLPLSALQNHSRDSLHFEAMRHQPQHSSLRLITLGSPARHLARKTFAEHALAAGGFQAETVDLEQAISNSFDGIQVLCGHDDDYENAKEQIATLLKENAAPTFIASKKALREEFPSAQRLHLGMNLLSFLQSISHASKEG